MASCQHHIAACHVVRKTDLLLTMPEDGQALDVEVADGYLSWQRRIEQIVEEERLDGIYVIRPACPLSISTLQKRSRPTRTCHGSNAPSVQ